MIPFDRTDFANALVAYASMHPGNFADRIAASRTADIATESYLYKNTHWEILKSLEPEAQALYFALVAKHEGAQRAEDLSSDYARIQDPKGVTILVENSDDDPFSILFTINDSGDSGEGIADAWADCHGSLCCGTWESGCPDFVYDQGYFYPGLFDEITEYDLNFSVYSEPSDTDCTIAQHAAHCDDCDGDFRQAEKHLANGPLFARTGGA